MINRSQLGLIVVAMGPSLERVPGAGRRALPHHGLREGHEGGTAEVLPAVRGPETELRGRRDEAGGNVRGRRLRQPHPPREGAPLRHRLAPQRPLPRRQQTQGITATTQICVIK